MQACVIFNPAAKGQKAERLRARLDIVMRYAVLRKTAAAGDARRFAAEAIGEGCHTVIAAGGDGTIHEVINGIGDANAFDRVRLGVLPLGTINVFAREMEIPSDPDKAWSLIVRGRYTRIDLGWAEFSENGAPQRRYFMQLGGVGLDARAIQLVDMQHKKRIGPMAYVLAGLKALLERQPRLTVTANKKSVTGELALFGNGKLYGGRMAIFPQARLRDGMLDVCVFSRASLVSVLGDALFAAVVGRLPGDGEQRLHVAEFAVTAEQVNGNARPTNVGFELDGEWVGRLPAKFGVEREKLRVIVP